MPNYALAGQDDWLAYAAHWPHHYHIIDVGSQREVKTPLLNTQQICMVTSSRQVQLGGPLLRK